MPDENRFAGLGDQLDPDDVSEQSSTEDDGSDGSRSEQTDGPAFAFEATQAKSIYVRPETLDLLEDVEFEVESLLRREHGVRDLTGREFHDAVVQAVATNPEVVAELVIAAREE